MAGWKIVPTARILSPIVLKNLEEYAEIDNGGIREQLRIARLGVLSRRSL